MGKIKKIFILPVFAILVFVLLLSIHESHASTIHDLNRVSSQAHTVNLAPVVMEGLQLPFIQNVGQSNSQVKFYANTFGGTVFVTNNGLTYSILNPNTDKVSIKEKGGLSNEVRTVSAIQENFVDAKLDPAGIQKSITNVNYFIGNSKQDWHTNIPAFDTITLGTVWPGIDLDLRAHGNNVEKIFTVYPGSSVQKIKIGMQGIKSLTVSNGHLLISTEKGTLLMTKPLAYQKIGDNTIPVDVSYTVSGTTYGFNIGSYDKTHPVIIDPLLASTYLGGNETEKEGSIILDSAGNVYITGGTLSQNFPITSNAYQPHQKTSTSQNVFVSKLSNDLKTLVASTFIGGSNNDLSYSIDLDSAGNVFITGNTTSHDFPIIQGAYQNSFTTGNSIFVAKLDKNLSTLLASTFIGGSTEDVAYVIALNSTDYVFISGFTDSSKFPTTPGAYQQTFPVYVTSEAFVSEFDPSLSKLGASTFIGGSVDQFSDGIALNSTSYVYITGDTTSPDFPTTPGAYQTTNKASNGHDNAFVSEFDPSLSKLGASTFIGGNGSDDATGIILDSSNHVYITGGTSSPNFPTTPGAYQTTNKASNGHSNVFVSEFSSDLTKLPASTLIGGHNDDISYAIINGSSNSIYISGTTNSVDFPTTPGAYQTTLGHVGANNVFVSKLNSGLTSLISSTYLGGTQVEYDVSYGLGLDSSGNIIVSGTTNSADFPTTPGAYQTVYGGGSGDAFVSKFDSNLSVNTSCGNFPNTVVATIPVGPVPYGAAFDPVNDDVYVVNQNYSPSAGTVSVIDGNPSHSTHNQVVGSPITVGADPVNVAFDSANGYLYVTNSQSNSVSVIDGATNTLATISPNPIPLSGMNSPYGIAYDSTNKDLYVTSGSSPPNTVLVIDGNPSSPTYNTIISTIPGFGGPTGIEFDPSNDYLYVTNFNTNSVSVIDARTNTLATGFINPIPVGTKPMALALDHANGYLYVVNSLSNSVSVIDTATNTLATGFINPILVGTDPLSITFDSIDGNLYVPNSVSDSVSVISTASNTVVFTVSVGSNPQGVTFDAASDEVYVVNDGSDNVSVISPCPVPEFGSMAGIILVSSIISVIVISRKLKFVHF